MIASLAAGVAVASAAPVELPPPPTSSPAPGAPPAPAQQPAPSPAATPAPPAASATRPPAATVRLALGATGPAVRDLQRELRRRGQRIAVDGAFGPATRRAVARMQKRLRMRVTGVADAALLKRLGLRTRAAASAPVAATPAPAAAPVPGASRYLKAFPVAGRNSYFDDYGAPRHQGPHQGIDVMADRGTPLVAVDDAVVHRLTRVESGLGGIYVWLERADGVQYYYAHMNSIAAGLSEGTKVTAGQIIGTVGNSGDARYGATHLHFEIRLNGGRTPTNPYPHLVAVDPAARTAARTPR